MSEKDELNIKIGNIMEQEERKKKKIGFLETYNSESGRIEKSSDRLKSVIALIMAFLIVAGQLYVGGDFQDWGFVAVVFIFLLYSATPKALKDIAAIKSFASQLQKGDKSK
jgi:hypothetical protein